ncbi:ABC transporter ATP-binding protein [Geobacter sp. DSM 9736]|uniref:ABC transporter ATP-binding protein n=1 Tax=Geobacter sp. DSM 9736 TaxID=1277350 RepID=UPI000B504351|nr:ABC transporter ATP-binding protein [Geobacter sp. DSM 9736]SNB46620.1 ABC-type bacteriocin/lantibiotic exporter, contains an N-terminal double-glycine peptidase domain [Geobacter sp. DSM 9736]
MIKAVKVMWDLIPNGEKKYLFLLFAVIFAMSFIETLGIASIMPFMRAISNPSPADMPHLVHDALDFIGFQSASDLVLPLGIALFGLLVVSSLLKALIVRLSIIFENNVNQVLGRRLLANYLSKEYSFFLNRHTSDMGKNILFEARNVISCFAAALQVVSSVLMSLLIMSLLVLFEPLVAVAIAISLGGSYGAVFLFTRNRLSRIGKEQVHAVSLKHKAANEALNGVKEIKVLGRERFFIERFSVHAEHYSRNCIAAGTVGLLPRLALEVMAFGGILLIVFYLIGNGGSADQIIPLLAVYAFAGYRILPALQQIFSGIGTIRLNAAGLELLHGDLVKEPQESQGNISVVNEAVLPLPFDRELRLDNVGFRYTGASGPTLDGVTLTILKNTSVGLVGATGSGKTTLVDIILGLLVPTSGEVLVDGIRIRDEQIPYWRRNIGYVHQQIFLSDDSIARNIAFGVPDSIIDMAAVIRAARVANLHSFIENRLPEGYETIIGERGVRLSGGQRQRIAIARALYRNPSLLIMDEATNALDGVTEAAVMDALREVSGKKTVIMIAHRLTTVKGCDIIYMLQNGRIVSHGTYEELTKSSRWFQLAAGHS